MKTRWYKRMWPYILGILFVLATIVAIQYAADIHAAYERLNHYTVKTINTEYGKLSYMDEGSGEAILISHGIFGGYDQGLVSLEGLVGNGYRKIAPSRFGYPDSSFIRSTCQEKDTGRDKRDAGATCTNS